MPKPKSLDYLFLFAVIALCAVGLTMIFSASPTMALKLGDTLYFVKRHLFSLILGFAALYYAYRLDLDKLKNKAVLIMIIAVVLLAAVFIPGVGRNVLGASRWIDLGLFQFQPSELIKFALVLFLAKWLADRQSQVTDLVKGFLPPLFWLGLVSLLIMKQPDMGTNLAIAGTFIVMLFVAGADLRHLGGLALLGIMAIAGLSIAEPYRLRRLLAYIDPWQDPQGIGFHIIQSLLAVGSGGLFGLGLGASRQKFFYLPQQFTDFIFAILCEELGFIGGAAVVGLFILFAARGFQIALATRDNFKRYLAVGLVSWLTIQTMINIMVVLGIIPTTGIPLPFISYGGTATIINLFAVGVVLNVSRKP